MDTRPDLARKGLITLLQLGVSAAAAVGLAAFGIQQAQPRKPAPSQIPPVVSTGSPVATPEPPVPVAVTTLPKPPSTAAKVPPPAQVPILAPEPEPLPEPLSPLPAVRVPSNPTRTAALPTTPSLPTRGLPTRPDLNPAPSNAAPSVTPPVEAEAPSARQTEFEEYARWLEMVQQERARLRSRTDTLSLRTYSARQSIPGPRIVNSTTGEGDRPAEPNQAGVDRAREALQSFEWRVSRAKPVVPSDCADLDRYYTQAIETETQLTGMLLDAVARGDESQVRALRRGGVSEVDRSLSIANTELERLARKRGMKQPAPVLRTGQSASLLGELTGPSGVR